MTTAAQAPIADLAPENGPLREYLDEEHFGLANCE